MSTNKLVIEPRMEGGGRSEVMLVKEDVDKAGGRAQTKKNGKYIKEVR